MYILYSLLLACGLVLSLPWWLFQMLRSGKYRAGLSERLGFVPGRLREAVGTASTWVHAVSVGEVLAVTHLVRELQAACPESRVFVSTVTQTGQYLARGRFGEDRAFFLPIDLGFAVRPYLNLLQPRLLILAETEFWPNLLHLAKKRGASIAVVNARISDRSFPRYRKFRWFFSPVLRQIDLFLAQTEEDARRLIEIGAPIDRVQVSGNLKFDVLTGSASSLAVDLRRAIPLESLVVVCGSTGEGEEAILLRAFQDCLQQYPTAVMAIAPRHPERFDSVADLVESMQIPLIRRSAWNTTRPISGGVFLLDSVGELASVYALADVAFVGGSLVPTGGHNILEPAQHGVAIMTGPYTFNFSEIIRIFVQDQALRTVLASSLPRELLLLLQDGEERKRLGNRARELFTQHAGASKRTLEALQALVQKKKSPPQ
jgi:3-deoxy-D-manno-octulosonic-acid transferase